MDNYDMHLGTDEAVEASEKKMGLTVSKQYQRKIHVEAQGRRPDFGRDENHNATGIKKYNTVYMICCCGARWSYAPGDFKEMYQEIETVPNIEQKTFLYKNAPDKRLKDIKKL